jgi:AbrB family looped-hinge helix DNA binding protein
MTAKITVDKAGRIVIPKPLRDQLQLGPGDALQLDSEGERITLRPLRPQATLKKEHGVWVYQGETTEASISDLIDQERETRLGGLRR